MAAIPVALSGVVYDVYGRTQGRVVIFGELSLFGVGVGGGPIIPPGQPPAGGDAHPEHPIYYPPHPSHPIYNPGGPPGSAPPGFWGGGMGPGVKPQPPFPPKPEEPPENPGIVKPPPEDGGWGWSPQYGWGYFPGDQNPGPKAAAPKK